jgi:hypothetical protein
LQIHERAAIDQQSGAGDIGRDVWRQEYDRRDFIRFLVT